MGSTTGRIHVFTADTLLEGFERIRQIYSKGSATGLFYESKWEDVWNGTQLGPVFIADAGGSTYVCLIPSTSSRSAWLYANAGR